MYKILAFIIFLSPLPLIANTEDNIIYQILEVHSNSDLNYNLINKYKNNGRLWNRTEEVLKLFKPVKGSNTVLVLMASFDGIGHYEEKDIFHEILILKINKNNIILDGLQYTLEWGEIPLACDLYRVTKSGIKIKKGLNVKELGFKSFSTECGPPSGKIDNIYKFKKVY